MLPGTLQPYCVLLASPVLLAAATVLHECRTGAHVSVRVQRSHAHAATYFAGGNVWVFRPLRLERSSAKRRAASFSLVLPNRVPPRFFFPLSWQRVCASTHFPARGGNVFCLQQTNPGRRQREHNMNEEDWLNHRLQELAESQPQVLRKTPCCLQTPCCLVLPCLIQDQAFVLASGLGRRV